MENILQQFKQGIGSAAHFLFDKPLISPVPGRQDVTLPGIIQNLFSGGSKVLGTGSTISPTPTPDPWVKMGYTKAGGGYYRPSENGNYTIVDRDKIPAETLRKIEPSPWPKTTTVTKSPTIPTRAATATPTPMPTTIPTNGQTPYYHSIVIPDNGGKTYEIPQSMQRGGETFNFAQALMESFGDINEATNAAQMLRHPMQSTAIAGEKARGVNRWPNRGENPEFTWKDIDIPNPDGTIDRGLARINSSTFNEMKKSPFWGKRMENYGINNWDDMENPLLNLKMARLILEYHNWDPEAQRIKQNPSYSGWYAAPKELRARRPK